MQELVFLIGLPAAGKSTVANRYRDLGYVILSSDKMREHLYGNVNTQDFNGELFTRLYKIARKMLSLNKNVVIDATNITIKNRKNAINSILTNTKKDEIQLDLNNINVIAQIVLCPYNECIDRNKSRDRQVPSHVIEKMYKSWETPVHGEGFKSIRLNYTSDTNFCIEEEIERLSNIHQHNKHHTLTIGEHCKLVGDNLFKDTSNEILKFSGYLHDITKPFCMQFKNSKGEYTKDATYYGHDCASAYDSLLYLKNSKFNEDQILTVSILINSHMKIKFYNTEKAINKLKNNIGEYNFYMTELLSEYDNTCR